MMRWLEGKTKRSLPKVPNPVKKSWTSEKKLMKKFPIAPVE